MALSTLGNHIPVLKIKFHNHKKAISFSTLPNPSRAKTLRQTQFRGWNHIQFWSNSGRIAQDRVFRERKKSTDSRKATAALRASGVELQSRETAMAWATLLARLLLLLLASIAGLMVSPKGLIFVFREREWDYWGFLWNWNIAERGREWD